MNIYIHKNEQQIGPFDESQISEALSRGEISFEDLAWKDGLTEWVRLGDLIEKPQQTPPLPKNPIIQNSSVVQTNVKQGAVIGGWVCFVLGTFTMYLSMWTFFIYGPLLLVAFILSIIAMAQRRILGGISLLLTTLVIPSILGLYLFTMRTSDFVNKTLGVQEVKTSENNTQINKKLDEKNGFREFKLGLPLTNYEAILTKVNSAFGGDIDKQSYHVSKFDKKIGNTQIEYIAVDFNQDLLTQIRVGVEGKENSMGLKESLLEAFGNPSDIKTSNNDETLIWKGKETRLDFSSSKMLGGKILSTAKYTNSSVNMKVEEILKQKAKSGAADGAKSL